MTWFGTYIRRGELILHPYWEYYRDRNREYKPQELVMSWPECKVANSVPPSERASRGVRRLQRCLTRCAGASPGDAGCGLRNRARRVGCYSAAG